MANSAAEIEGLQNITSLQSRSILDVFADKKKLGIIKDCNMCFCKWYGALKARIVGLNIDKLIPYCFQKTHRKNLNTSFSQEVLTDKKRFVLIINNTGYLCPLYMQMIYCHELAGDPHLICSFYPKKINNKITAYLLFDSKLILRNISTYAVTLLGLNLSEINSKHFHLSTLFPSLNEDNLKGYIRKKVIVNYQVLEGAKKHFQASNSFQKNQFCIPNYIRLSITVNCFKFRKEEDPSAYYLLVREYFEQQKSEEINNIFISNNKLESPNPETQFLYSNQFGLYVRNYFPGKKYFQKAISMDLMEQGLKRVVTLKGQESDVSANCENIVTKIESFCNNESGSVFENLNYLNWIGPKIVEIHARLSFEAKKELEGLLREHFFRHYINHEEQIATKRIAIVDNQTQFLPVRTCPGFAEYTYRSDLLSCMKEDESCRQKGRAKASVINQDYRANQALLSDEDLLGQIFERHQTGKYFLYITLYFYFVIFLHLTVELPKNLNF